MDKLPQTKIGDTVSFKFGEIIYRCPVYNGKITGIKAEHQISNDTSRSDILKDLMSIAADTVEGKEVQVIIKADKQGPYRITKTVISKTTSGRVL